MIRAVILGATASLGKALCQALAKQNINLILFGRDQEALTVLASDLTIRFGITTETHVLDVMELKQITAWETTISTLPTLDMVFSLVGAMSKDHSSQSIIDTIHTNFTGPAVLLSLFAQKLQKQQYSVLDTAPGLHTSGAGPPRYDDLGASAEASPRDLIAGSSSKVKKHPIITAHSKKGKIIVVTSVAGDRGRKSNYVYGSAKAGLSIFAAGLRHAYWKEGIHVLIIKPGYIDTPMTYGIKSSLIASREYVARKIIQAAQKNQNEAYIPFFWKFIVFAIKLIPETIFKRLPL